MTREGIGIERVELPQYMISKVCEDDTQYDVVDEVS